MATNGKMACVRLDSLCVPSRLDIRRNAAGSGAPAKMKIASRLCGAGSESGVSHWTDAPCAVDLHRTGCLLCRSRSLHAA